MPVVIVNDFSVILNFYANVTARLINSLKTENNNASCGGLGPVIVDHISLV